VRAGQVKLANRLRRSSTSTSVPLFALRAQRGIDSLPDVATNVVMTHKQFPCANSFILVYNRTSVTGARPDISKLHRQRGGLGTARRGH
jgi:hypothetical protein